LWTGFYGSNDPTESVRALRIGFNPTRPCYNPTHACNNTYTKTRMWANAECDCRPAEYRWCPVFNAAVWLTPTTRVPCSNTAETRNPLKLPQVPQTNETISAASGPKFTILWGTCRSYCCLTSFFPIVDTCLSCEDIARQSCGMMPRWRFFWALHLQQAACITFQTYILNSH